MNNLWERVQALYGVRSFTGCPDAQIERLREKFGALPQMVEEFYRTAAASEAFRHGQDRWVMPKEYEEKNYLKESEHLVLLIENQGVCSAGVLKQDLHEPDPPVYVTMDDKNWTLCADSVSDFLLAALCYECVFDLPYTTEDCFYEITPKEYSLIKRKLTPLPARIQDWLNFDILLYQNAPDNIVVVLDCDDDLQMLYGAATKESFQRLMEVLDGVGEPL